MKNDLRKIGTPTKVVDKFKMNRKGVLGLDTATAFVIAILTLAVVAFAVIVALASLNNSNVLTTGSQEANQTTNVLNNVTAGVAELFTNATTWFSLLAVVIIILIIALVILAVRRFDTTANSGGGGL